MKKDQGPGSDFPG